MSSPEETPEAIRVEAASGEGRRVQELQATIDALQARLHTEEKRHNEEIRQFAYTVSHDLREPLRMVASYTQLLNRRYGTRLDEDAREFVGFIVEAVRRMEKLLTDLLTYSRQFNPPAEPPRLIDTEVVLQSALLAVDRQIRETGAQITNDPLPQITFDFERMALLFRQLISNALKFRGSEPPRIHIAAKEADDEVTFSIRDNGLGIDPRYHDQIFGVFRRLHGKEQPGTGIGLALCKRIVEQQGGRIWVESEIGKGAIFHFTLPQ